LRPPEFLLGWAPFQFWGGDGESVRYSSGTTRFGLAAACTLCVGALLAPSPASALSDSRMLDPEDRSGNWSVGMANAWENSPYQGQGRLPNFTPTYSYSGKRLYIDTTDIGWHAIDNPRWQLDLYGSYRLDGFNEFSGDTTGGEPRPDDDPLKGLERSNAFEASVQLTRKLPLGRFALEARQDVSGVHDGAALRARWARVYRRSHWQVEPWAEFGWWSDQRADYYFGVRPDEASATRPAASVGSTTHWGVGTALRYTLWQRHHLNLNLAYRQFADGIEDSPIVDTTAAPSVEIGYRYELNELRVPAGDGAYDFLRNNGSPWSLRLAYGCTTETKLNAIIRGDINCSDDDTHLASLFAGRQVARRVFGLPLEAWMRGGVARRFENDLQDDFWEVVIGARALFRRFPWSEYVETRIGIGNGISYAGSPPALEQRKAVEKNRATSRMLHYLDVNLDVSVGDVLRVPAWERLYFGFSVHHRSGIFSSADIYSNVYGGSNVNTLYLEWEFN
jgi:outer membrane protein